MEKRVFAGYYKRYDGKSVYVVDIIKDIDTGAEIVICRNDTHTDSSYYAISKESFCQAIEIAGEQVPKYKRNVNREKINHWDILKLTQDGYPSPNRRISKKEHRRIRRNSKTYLRYAKDLCEWYSRDMKIYRLCVKEKKLVGVESKTDFDALKEDLQFLSDCLHTVLKDYTEYFRERFIEKRSIRKYAEAHNIGRGSVDYIQKKFMTALAKCLENRDKSDGINRLALII